MRAFYPAVLTLLALLALNACIAVPVPWFPRDPHKEDLESLLAQEIILREDIVREFGKPWAAWDERSFIYISDRPSSYLVYGGIGGGEEFEMSRRDFVLMFNFDELGTLKDHEVFADTGDRDYCFSNNVCFGQSTDNVPLRPVPVENTEPKLENHGLCTVYLYRDEVADSRTYSSYVDIHLRKDEKGLFTPIGSSVAEGINVWHLEPAAIYEMKANFTVDRYPFKVSESQIRREDQTLRFFCDAGEKVYVRLAVPKSKKKATEFTWVNESTAKEFTKGLPVLLGYYAPELLPYQHSIR